MSSLKQHPELIELQALAKARRVSLFLVGGYWRDSFLGRSSRDLDFAVSKNAIVLARAFAKKIRGAFVLLDKESGCARVAKKHTDGIWTYDFADFRAPTLKGDLAKRDFTVNTLCAGLNEALLDAAPKLDGHRYARRDIKAKLVRMVSAKALAEDPLRLLRAFTLKAQFGFRIEPKTRAAIKKGARRIRDVSIERVRDELFKILGAPEGYAAFREMDGIGFLLEVIPQLKIMRDVPQGGYHHLNVWEHSLETFRQFDLLLQEFADDPDMQAYLNEDVGGAHTRRALVRLACMLHDIGKPDTRKKEPDGRTSFHGHEHEGRRIARIVAYQLKLSVRERHALEDMVTLHLRPGYLSNFKRPSDKAVYRFMRAAKDEAASIILLALADQRSTRGPLTTEYDLLHHDAINRPLIAQYFNKKKEKPFVRLLSGHDLIKEFKLEPGPVFATILMKVEEAQQLGKVKTKAEAVVLAKKLVGGC
ncbi:MAG: HD domain-containing protein [Candidatus Omnitrophica bacterium]|nr:HD domain-containing protein [Candidatus Omnitrophota bacterium]